MFAVLLTSTEEYVLLLFLPRLRMPSYRETVFSPPSAAEHLLCHPGDASGGRRRAHRRGEALTRDRRECSSRPVQKTRAGATHRAGSTGRRCFTRSLCSTMALIPCDAGAEQKEQTRRMGLEWLVAYIGVLNSVNVM